MKVTVLVGGVGGARFLLGVRELPDVEVTAVVNVGDDIWLHGLRICPDLDTCMYTLGGGIDTERGWGRSGETWAVRDELAAYGADPDWFGLGDRDTATHLVRTRMLRAGYPLSDVTAALCHRWQPGVTLLPASRRPRRDPRRRRRPGQRAEGAQGHPLPGVVDPAQGRAARAPVRLRRGRARRACCPRPATRSSAPTPCCSRRPTRSCRSAPSSTCRACATRCATRRRRWSGSRRSSAGARCAAWPTPASTRSASRPPPRAWGGTSAPAPTAACSTAGSCTPATPPTCPGSTSAPCRCS